METATATTTITLHVVVDIDDEAREATWTGTLHCADCGTVADVLATSPLLDPKHVHTECPGCEADTSFVPVAR